MNNKTGAKRVLNKSKAKNGAQPRIAANGYRLPNRLPPGELITDSTKEQWVLGDTIGCGGFGEIYLAKRKGAKRTATGEWNYVVKIDHYSGPLFPEIHFYHRVAKGDEIDAWCKKNGLAQLGMPRYIASGIHDKQSQSPPAKKKGKAVSEPINKYRFLVMQRFGSDLQKVLDSRHGTLSLHTAYTLAIKVIDVLKYIHSHGYIHADIKASNLLLEREKGDKKTGNNHSSIYLVDYGLVEKYNFDGSHRKHEEDQRRANNGTVEFTSRDAHIGALSRRSDLEILGFNVLSWLSGGRLPWMMNLKDHSYVRTCKEYYMKKLHELVNFCFNKNESAVELVKGQRSTSPQKSSIDRSKISSNVPPGVLEFLQYIGNLEFSEEPNYNFLRTILEKSMEKSGLKYTGKFCFENKSPAKILKAKRTSISSPQLGRRKVAYKVEESDSEEDEEEDENDENESEEESPPKRQRFGREIKKEVKKAVVKKTRGQSISAPTSASASNAKVTSRELTPSRIPFDNPTPAMVELLQRLKEKRLQRQQSDDCLTENSAKKKGSKLRQSSSNCELNTLAVRERKGNTRTSPRIMTKGRTVVAHKDVKPVVTIKRALKKPSSVLKLKSPKKESSSPSSSSLKENQVAKLRSSSSNLNLRKRLVR